MFKNKSDSALQDLLIHDIVPSSFEIKGYNIRSDSGVREADMEKADDENGIKVTWHIPVIEKDERIEVIYELVGDSNAEYKVSEAQEFHGATFGDELDVDIPAAPPEEEEIADDEVEESDSSDESDEAAPEEDDDSGDEAEDDDSGDEAEDDGSGDEAEDDDSGDEAEDDDSGDEAEDDDSGDEAEDDAMDAALAQITGDDGDTDEEKSPEEGSTEEGGRTCPICSTENAPGANVCGTCSFDFE